MEHKYVDEFFNTGRLMLSTLQRCREFEVDDVRCDQEEGRSRVDIDDRGLGISSSNIARNRSLMLCASMVESKAMAARFGVGGCIAINDAAGFSCAISQKIGGVVSSELGPCFYQDGKIDKRSGDLNFVREFSEFMLSRNLSDDQIREAFEKVNKRISSELDADDPSLVFFHKPSLYAEDAEYRFIWHMDNEVGNGMFIECPDAIRFCSRKF